MDTSTGTTKTCLISTENLLAFLLLLHHIYNLPLHPPPSTHPRSLTGDKMIQIIIKAHQLRLEMHTKKLNVVDCRVFSKSDCFGGFFALTHTHTHTLKRSCYIISKSYSPSSTNISCFPAEAHFRAQWPFNSRSIPLAESW